MTEQQNNPSSDIANADPSTADVNALQPAFKAIGGHTKHEGLLRPPMIAVYINGNDDPLYLKIAEPVTFGRDTTLQSQPTLIELGTTSHEQGVSRQHARVSWRNGLLFIEDLASSNSTFVNRVKLIPYLPRRLSSGDLIELGQMALEIYFVSELPPEEVAPADQTQPVAGNALLLPASTQPAAIEHVATLRLTDGLILLEDLPPNDTNNFALSSDITLKLKQVAESNSTLVLEIDLTDPVVQKAIQELFTNKPVLEMTELKMRIVRHLG